MRMRSYPQVMPVPGGRRVGSPPTRPPQTRASAATAYAIAYLWECTLVRTFIVMNAINATTARKSLFSLIKRANDDAETFEITSPNGNVFLVPEAEYRSMQETAYLLRSPANARELRKSIAEAEGGQVVRPQETEDGGFE